MKEYDIAGKFKIGKYRFEIIEQFGSSQNTYGVKVFERNQDSFWLDVNGKSFETYSGALGAIVIFLDFETGEGNKID